MCSIFGILDIKSDAVALRKTALEMSKRLRHRGPDWSGIYSTDKAILVHERLSIVDPVMVRNRSTTLNEPTSWP